MPELDVPILARHWTAWVPPGYESPEEDLAWQPRRRTALSWNQRFIWSAGPSVRRGPLRPADVRGLGRTEPATNRTSPGGSQGPAVAANARRLGTPPKHGPERLAVDLGRTPRRGVGRQAGVARAGRSPGIVPNRPSAGHPRAESSGGRCRATRYRIAPAGQSGHCDSGEQRLAHQRQSRRALAGPVGAAGESGAMACPARAANRSVAPGRRRRRRRVAGLASHLADHFRRREISLARVPRSRTPFERHARLERLCDGRLGHRAGPTDGRPSCHARSTTLDCHARGRRLGMVEGGRSTGGIGNRGRLVRHICPVASDNRRRTGLGNPAGGSPLPRLPVDPGSTGETPRRGAIPSRAVRLWPPRPPKP